MNFFLKSDKQTERQKILMNFFLHPGTTLKTEKRRKQKNRKLTNVGGDLPASLPAKVCGVIEFATNDPRLVCRLRQKRACAEQKLAQATVENFENSVEGEPRFDNVTGN